MKIQQEYDMFKDTDVLPAIYDICSDLLINFNENLPSLNELYERCVDLTLRKKQETAEMKDGPRENVIYDIIQGTEAFLLLKTSSKFFPLSRAGPPKLSDIYFKIIKPTSEFSERVKAFNNALKGLPTSESRCWWNISNFTVNEVLYTLSQLPVDDMQKIIHIQIEGNEAIDVGGVLKSMLSIMGEQFRQNTCEILKSHASGHVYFNPDVLVRFKHSMNINNNKEEDDENSDEYSKKKVNSDEATILLQDYLRGFGRLIGLSITRNSINATIASQFPITLFKLILGYPLEFSDLESFSPDISSSIKQLALMPAQSISSMDLTFAVLSEVTTNPVNSPTTSTEKKTLNHDLIPNGSNIDVTGQNRNQYLKMLIQYYLGKHLPLKYFSLGVQDVCPRELLSVFTPPMLQLLVCGQEAYDVEDLITHMKIEQSLQGHIVIEWLYKCLRNMSSSDIALFLTFVTGSTVLPVGGAAMLSPQLSVRKSSNKSSLSLPISHTCFNLLEVPLYAQYEDLSSKLLLAIQCTSAIDFGMV